MRIINNVRTYIRAQMDKVAVAINRFSGGKVTPNQITIIGFLLHLPIAALIASDILKVAALLLIIFGLFDALDGALARLQKKSSDSGMLLDASTDRFKEVLLYSGAAFNISSSEHYKWAFLAVAACGASLCVSYVKAKGESAVATSGKKINHTTLNKMFADGLAAFEIRISILIFGLFADQIVLSLAIIAVLSTYTAFYRLVNISRFLKNV